MKTQKALLILLSLAAALGSYLALHSLAGPELARSGATATALFIAVFIFVYLAGTPWVERGEVKQRLELIARVEASTSARQRKLELESAAFATGSSRLGSFVESASGLLKLDEDGLPGLRQKLAAAGLRKEGHLYAYVLLKLVGLFGGTAVGSLLVHAAAGDATTVVYLTGALAGAAAGYYGPDRIIKARTARRRTRIQEQLPDVLDLMVIYTESGASFDKALIAIVVKAGVRYPIVCSELQVLEQELRIYPDRATAFDNLVRRTNNDLVRRFVTILKQSEKIGSPVSEALRLLADDSRKERMLLAERRAARIPVVIQLPIIAFILPALMLLVMGPVAISIYETVLAR